MRQRSMAITLSSHSSSDCRWLRLDTWRTLTGARVREIMEMDRREGERRLVGHRIRVTRFRRGSQWLGG